MSYRTFAMAVLMVGPRIACRRAERRGVSLATMAKWLGRIHACN